MHVHLRAGRQQKNWCLLLQPHLTYKSCFFQFFTFRSLPVIDRKQHHHFYVWNVKKMRREINQNCKKLWSNGNKTFKYIEQEIKFIFTFIIKIFFLFNACTLVRLELRIWVLWMLFFTTRVKALPHKLWIVSNT